MDIAIEDSELTFKASILILEELLHLGCDNFSVQLNISYDGSGSNRQKQFKTDVVDYSLGSFTKEVFFFSHKTCRFSETSEHYAFNRNSIPIISRAMGRGLMCFKADLEWGISEWQFYSGSVLLAGANVKDDYFFMTGVEQRFVDLLTNVNIPIVIQT
ncbi:hypothetical protein L1D31_21955 [Vibrio sp. Isolate23]|uniref:hypothetical protein n=1 Tax=Vibrio sp. Isolate23 TaxID=2908533 RepID=UPI001EFE09BB|nr:hypothetical protein [Vibrio sp. Isolate23]MCG9685189.1 hypothetical protein [Vibrio sp. Isolate23]